MTRNLGIDEAGRGPVIGPLVICGCIVSSDDKKELLKLGIKDSKQVTPKKREELFSYLISKYKYELIIVQPKEIDSAVSGESDNLNDLEARKAAEIIKTLKQNNEVDSVVIDCPSTNILAYTKQMKKLIDDNVLDEKTKNKETKIICEHKADVNHIEVSCASIIAKVTRDRIIEKLNVKYKELGDIGSGYPSDPTTREFVKKNYANKSCKEIFRKSWQTYIKMVEKNKQNKLEKFF